MPFFSSSPRRGYSVVPNILFSVIPSVAEESRGNDTFLISRGGVARGIKFTSARAK